MNNRYFWRYLPLSVIAIVWIELMNDANENIGWCITAGALISALLPTVKPIRFPVLIFTLIISLALLLNTFLWR